MLTGLAAAVAFRARLWNIGAEGQFYLGAIAVAAFGSRLLLLLAVDAFVPLLLVVGAIAGLVLCMSLTLRQQMVLLFVLTFLVQGTVKFFAGTNALSWVCSGLAMLLALRMVVDSLMEHRPPAPASRVPALMVFLLLYVSVFLFSLLVHHPKISQAASAVKNTFPLMAVLFAFGFARWEESDIAMFWRFLVVVAFAQLPVVVYQHFVTAAHRAVQGFDSVVGTFGGSQEGGGLNAMMVMFIITTMCYALARQRTPGGYTGMTVMLWLSGLAIILLGEVKAAFVWLPIAVFFVQRRKFARNPFALIGYLLAGALLFGVVYVTYKTVYWGRQQGSGHSLSEKLENMGGYFFDTHNIDYTTGEISRAASIALWVQDPKADIATRMIGYGPGASKTYGALGAGVVAQRYSPLQIDLTALSTQLWDTGVLGALFYFGFLASAFFSAWRSAQRLPEGSVERLHLETAAAALLTVSSLLVYNRTLVDEPVVQLFVFFFAGLALRASRRGPDSAPALVS